MYLGIDYGKKRIGLALGVIIPHGVGFIDASLGDEIIFSKISDLCRENEVEAIIIGLPIRSQGEDGTIGDEIKSFSAKIEEKTGLPVYFEEEQFTSAEAERLLGPIDRKKREEGKVDELAAVLLLEQFINNKK